MQYHRIIPLPIVLDDARCILERDFCVPLNGGGVAIEGLPVKALTRNTYAKIVASWGELVLKSSLRGCFTGFVVKEKEAWMPELQLDGKSINPGGILCFWDPRLFVKDNSTVSDSFLAISEFLADGMIGLRNLSLVKNVFSSNLLSLCYHEFIVVSLFDYQFPNRLTPDQIKDLERNVSYEEIKRAVWDCGISKSPGPDGSFPPWCTLRFSCLNSAVGSIIVNGSPSRRFIFSKGSQDQFLLIVSYGLVISHDVVATADKSYCLARLSNRSSNSLSIGGRLTLIKSVLSSLPLYYMSSFKVPKGVLSKMESIRRNFFNGVENAEKKIVVIAIYGIRGALDNSSSYSRRSPWLDIVNEVRKLASKGIDLLSLVKKKVGNGKRTKT
ncbi:hypothetical protein Tco_0692140 [Tanacetum coccineum]